MMGAPKQAELARKLVVLDTLLSAFAGSVVKWTPDFGPGVKV
jgi:hypothetical protein